MNTYYTKESKFFNAIDCVVFGYKESQLYLLMATRNVEPLRGEWSLMGGFLREDESLEDAAKRILLGYTGLNEIFLEQVGTFSAINRDPGGRVLSTVYYALVDIDRYNHKLIDTNNAQWFPLKEIPRYIMDHHKMVKEALKALRMKAATRPIGITMLPPLFTLSELQSLFEVIFDKEIDKRNFRKKVASYSFIEKTDKIDKTKSKRGAALYRFNKNIYEASNEPDFVI